MPDPRSHFDMALPTLPVHTADHAGPAAALKLVAVGLRGDPEGSDAALLGAMIARACRAELMLVAVERDRPPAVGQTPGRTEGDVRAMLRDVRGLIGPGAHIEIEHDRSMPRALLRVVGREHADLLVLGSSRRAPTGRVRIGRRTRRLVEDAQCALAVAPRGLCSRDQPRLDVIGVAYDGEPEARQALTQAGALARASGALLRVRAVVDNRLPATGWTPTDGPNLAEIEDEVIEPQMEAMLENAEREASATGAGVAVEVRPGSPMEEIVAFSREVDLLAIGSRRWGAAKGVLFGTTGEGLLHGSYCSVMVVPPPALCS